MINDFAKSVAEYPEARAFCFGMSLFFAAMLACSYTVAEARFGAYNLIDYLAFVIHGGAMLFFGLMGLIPEVFVNKDDIS